MMICTVTAVSTHVIYVWIFNGVCFTACSLTTKPTKASMKTIKLKKSKSNKPNLKIDPQLYHFFYTNISGQHSNFPNVELNHLSLKQTPCSSLKRGQLTYLDTIRPPKCLRTRARCLHQGIGSLWQWDNQRGPWYPVNPGSTLAERKFIWTTTSKSISRGHSFFQNSL